MKTRRPCAHDISVCGLTRGRCRECVRAERRAWAKANPDRRRGQEKRNRVGNPIYQARVRNRTYGLKPGEYDAMFTKQNGVCAICKETCSTGHSLSVDHEHFPPYRIRGLLCKRCNRGLGTFKDRADLLLAAADYLT